MQNKKIFQSKIISTISNKGGVGKTMFSIEMANILGKNGKKVLLIDTDMNTGDISIKLGLRNNLTLLDFFEKKETNLENLIKPVFNFDLIPGAGGNFKFANLNYVQKIKFIRAFKAIAQNYEYTILDLGAGIDRITLDFALTADFNAIVTTPEDIQSGYGCAKAAAERLNELELKQRKKDRFYVMTNRLNTHFIFNKAKEESAKKIFAGVAKAAEVTKSSQDISIKPYYAGYVPAAYKVVERSYTQYNRPVSEIYPNTEMSNAYKQIAEYILKLNNDPAPAIYRKKSPLEKIMSFFNNEKESKMVV